MSAFALNAGQEFIVQKAVEWFEHSNEQLFQYDGPPGAGKSVVLNEIVTRLGLGIGNIAPMSFIGAASLVMRTKGLTTAKTAHSWCYEMHDAYKKDLNGNILYYPNGEPMRTKVFRPKKCLEKEIQLIIIDEAYSMPRHMRPTIENFNLKILACGDQNQLPPVKGYPAFLVDGQIYHLTEIMRQGDKTDINFIARRASLGWPLLNGYYGNSLVIEREDLTDEMLAWADIIICGRNRTRDIINRHVRKLKGFPNTLLPNYGERVVCRNNNWDIAAKDRYNNDINLVNGLIGTVVNQPSLDTYNADKNVFEMDFRPDLAPECLFHPEVNYDYMISDSINRNIIKDDPHNSGSMFELAYAITCHIAQGSQFSKVIYIEESMPPSIKGALNLVGATRAVNQLIYVKNNFKPFEQYYDPMEEPPQMPIISGYNKRMQRRIAAQSSEGKNRSYNGYKRR